MFQQLKSFINHRWLAQFRDVRVVGMVAFLVIALMFSYSGSKVIQRNYELQKQISQLQQENDVQQLANNNVKLENQYFNTDQYLELKARQDFGLGAKGETELIVPKEVAMAYVTPVAIPKQTVPQTIQRPAYQRNFEAWVSFFLHRQSGI